MNLILIHVFENLTDVTIQQKTDKKVVAGSSDSDEDDDDDGDQLQKLLGGEDVDTDEDDESFKINASAEADR